MTIVGELVLAVVPVPHRPRADRPRGDRARRLAPAAARAVRALPARQPARRRASGRRPRRPRPCGSSSPSRRRGRRSARAARPSSTAPSCSPTASRTSPATRRASSGSRARPARARRDAAPAKTSLAFWGSGDDSPGWLVRCLSEFAFRGVNLTKIESRPLRAQLGHYRFFVDCEGDARDEPVAARGRRPARALRAASGSSARIRRPTDAVPVEERLREHYTPAHVMATQSTPPGPEGFAPHPEHRRRGRDGGRVLVLNATYEPINVCTVRRAAVLLLKEKAEIVEHARFELRSEHARCRGRSSSAS